MADNKRRTISVFVVILACVATVAMLPATVRSEATSVSSQQQSEGNATATSLIQTRDAILSLLTMTPGTSVSERKTSAATRQSNPEPLSMTAALASTHLFTITRQIPGTRQVPLPTSTPEPPDQLVVEVIVDGLNIRSGPGVNYPIIGSAQVGMRFLIAGQANNCGWLNITGADGEIGWISGAPHLCSSMAPAQH
jgi:uncharacterized protein YgiM (DUF1202 family)